MAAAERDEVVDRFETYEEYLDTFISDEDMVFLGEEEIARLIVELGYRSSGTLSREKFLQTKAELSAARNISSKQEVDMEDGDSEKGDSSSTSGLLEAIRERFPQHLDNSLSTILFLSVSPEDGLEVNHPTDSRERDNVQLSGFIDLGSRMRRENFLPYLTGQKALRPRLGDLSFANLTRKRSRLCSSEDWKVRVRGGFVSRDVIIRSCLRGTISSSSTG